MRWVSLVTLAGVMACGGAVPLVEPVMPLAKGEVEVGAGVSSQLALGASQREIARARELDAVGSSQNSNAQFLRGAMRNSVVAPGVAPLLVGRAGLGWDSDASLTYTGRTLRLGARHVWVFGHYALSAGGGVASVATNPPDQAPPEDSEGLSSTAIDWPATGFGVDLPVTFGWSSDAQLLSAWVGGRIGYEALWGDFPFISGGQKVGASAQAQHLQVGGRIGLGVSVHPVAIRLELSAAYSRVSANAELPWADSEPEKLDDEFGGLVLMPAGAFSVVF
jgi:hypothetical protein